MKYVIGIDGSTTKTGISIFKVRKNHELDYVTHFLIMPEKFKYYKQKDISKQKQKELKLEHIKKRVEYTGKEFLKIAKSYPPSMILMEDTYAQNDISTLKWLCRLQGIIMGYSLQKNIPFILKFPSQWRKEVGMKISEDGIRYKNLQLKALSIQMVKEQYNLDVTDDEADAILIGQSGKNNLNEILN